MFSRKGLWPPVYKKIQNALRNTARDTLRLRDDDGSIGGACDGDMRDTGTDMVTVPITQTNIHTANELLHGRAVAV